MKAIRLIGLTPGAAAVSGGDRAALFSVTQALEGMPVSFADTSGYAARWASAQHHAELMTIEGHAGGVNAVCPITLRGRPHLATASDDRTVRIWDPAAGQEIATLQSDANGVLALCPVTVHGRPCLATAGSDGTVRICDPASSKQITVLDGHTSAAFAICPVTINGRPTPKRTGDGVHGSPLRRTPAEHRNLASYVTSSVNDMSDYSVRPGEPVRWSGNVLSVWIRS
jgi:WD40 repeat protein